MRAPAPVDLAPARPSRGPGRTRWARQARWLAFGIAFLVAVALAVWSLRPQVPYSGALDPGNTRAEGAAAVARVLDHQGVEVEIVRSAAEFDRTRLDARSQVVLSGSQNLGSETAARLLEHAGDVPLVVLQPDWQVPELLGHRAPARSVDPSRPVGADCSGPELAGSLDGLRLQVDRAESYLLPGCFRIAGRTLVAQPAPGLLLIGAGRAFSNDQVLHADNAAVALRLLGARERLVWYVPDAADLRAGDSRPLGDLIPTFVVPGLWLLGLAVVATMFWRGRRFGPLATEPLPVRAHAAEGTRARGRLYHRSGDRAHSAAAMRTAVRLRIADRLGVPEHDQAMLINALAQHVHQPPDRLWALLRADATAPTSDAGLLHLAQALAELDREVHIR